MIHRLFFRSLRRRFSTGRKSIGISATDDFWRRIPGYAEVSADEFRNHLFQQKNAVTNVRQLRDTLGQLVADSFYEDLAAGVERTPMALRISPYLVSLIDWSDPLDDPIRTQFLPLHSQQQPDHPMLRFDSLNEQGDSPVPGLTHRYDDKALFLPIDSCPVYCRFCTRSYAVGADVDSAPEKLKLHANLARWERAFTYIASRPELEDIVVSGGDTFNLRGDHLRLIGERLAEIAEHSSTAFRDEGALRDAAKNFDR